MKLKNFDDLIKERFTKEEIMAIDEQTNKEIKDLYRKRVDLYEIFENSDLDDLDERVHKWLILAADEDSEIISINLHIDSYKNPIVTIHYILNCNKGNFDKEVAKIKEENEERERRERREREEEIR